MPRFSIIVPVYNVEAYLSECLHSVESQDFSDYELILVDDGSTDGSAAICDSYASGHEHAEVIHQENQGLSVARNVGIAAARGEYLLLLDGDDLLPDGALRRISEHFFDAPEVIRFQVATLDEAGNMKSYSERPIALSTGIEAFPKLSRYHFIDNSWAYCYRRDFWQAHQFAFAAGRLAEDFGLTPLILARTTRFIAISDICYTYRARSGSIMHDQTKLAKRFTDAFAQLETLLPKLSTVPGIEPLLHYLVVSFFSGAASLGWSSREDASFKSFYERAKSHGWLRFIRPSSVKSYPRSLTLRFFPGLFCRLYA